MENPNSDLKNQILENIKNGHTNMKPRWRFVMQTALWSLGLLLAIFTMLYIASLVIFILQLNGGWFAPSFGLRGLGIFLLSLPWLLVLAAACLLLISEILAKKYAFTYRRPILYSVLGTLALVLVGGFLLSQTPMHSNLYVRAQNKRLPIAGRLYRRPPPPTDKLCQGQIQKLTGQSFEISSNWNETVTVTMDKSTLVMPPDDKLEIGDMVVIFGLRKDDTMKALTVKQVDRLFPRPKDIRLNRPHMPDYGPN